MDTNGNHDDFHEPSRGRETMLTLLLTGLGMGAFLLFLIFVTSGFFLYVVLAVGGITALGFVHYILWGRAMTQDVAGEQEHEIVVRRRSEGPRRGA
jgi:hypothetical protein